MQLSRRSFIVGTAGAAAVGFGLYSLRPKSPPPKPGITMPRKNLAKKIKYNDYSDIWREKWKWDKVVKDADEAGAYAAKMFDSTLVTIQTGPEGKGIYRVYVETAVTPARGMCMCVTV